MLISGVERSSVVKALPPDLSAMKCAVDGSSCISPSAPAEEVESLNFDSA